MNVIQFLNAIGETLEQGDVVVIGKNLVLHSYQSNGDLLVPEVDLTQKAYDTRVCGIVSSVYTEILSEGVEGERTNVKSKSPQAKTAKAQGKKAILSTQAFTAEELAMLDHGKIESGQMGFMVAFGLFPACKVDADIAPINVGDLLTTSPTRGHAQKALDPPKAVGAMIGKALGSLKKGKGKIPVLVMLQ
jgi:hypothetical protein